MDKKNFRIWMEKQKNYHTARTYTSRCLRVENEMHLNLDDEYKVDKGYALMQKLKYSRQESREQKQPQCGIIFNQNVDIYCSMHSIRASVKKYYEYLDILNNK